MLGGVVKLHPPFTRSRWPRWFQRRCFYRDGPSRLRPCRPAYRGATTRRRTLGGVVKLHGRADQLGNHPQRPGDLRGPSPGASGTGSAPGSGAPGDGPGPKTAPCRPGPVAQPRPGPLHLGPLIRGVSRAGRLELRPRLRWRGGPAWWHAHGSWACHQARPTGEKAHMTTFRKRAGEARSV